MDRDDPVRWLAFDTTTEAIEFSEQVIDRLQTPETKLDPETRTDYAFSWSINPDTFRTACAVPASMERHLTDTQRAALKTSADAVRDSDIAPTRELAIKPVRVRPQPPGGGGGGSSGRVR